MADTFTCEIIYIHHDCFFLRTGCRSAGAREDGSNVPGPDAAGVRTLLFDYPSPDHLTDAAARAAAPYFQDADLTVFVSHSHGDHFGPQVLELARAARRVEWIVSYDVADMYPEFATMDNAHVAEPEEPFTVRDMRITPVESTDLGVGFFMEWCARRLFFAGDVAEWDWEEGDEPSRAFAREFYGKSLAPLRSASPGGIDLAFHNADARLGNWAGGVRFVREIAPRYLVPMHAFGDTASLVRFRDAVRDAGVGRDTELLLFEAPGASRILEL